MDSNGSDFLHPARKLPDRTLLAYISADSLRQSSCIGGARSVRLARCIKHICLRNFTMPQAKSFPPAFASLLAALAVAACGDDTSTTDNQLQTYQQCGMTIPIQACFDSDCNFYRSICDDETTQVPASQAPQSPPVGGGANAPPPVGGAGPSIPPQPNTPTPPVGGGSNPPPPPNMSGGGDMTGTPPAGGGAGGTSSVPPSGTDTPPAGTNPPPVDTPPPSTGGDPAGFWRQGDWQGCVWTGVDDLGVGSNITPQDFTSGSGAPYCVSGKVGPSFNAEGVALLGFNLAQDPATADCTYTPVDASAEGPPAVQLTGNGIAINTASTGSFILRVQIQGPNGTSDPNDRWCATITETNIKGFIPWSNFNTECWEGGDGADYNGEPISAIVFTVPGDGWGDDWGSEATAEDVAFDFCVNGFAAGSSAQDAPDGDATLDQSGTIGRGDRFARAKVAVDGEQYIIQNNAWGQSGDLVMSYENNSFRLIEGSGSNNPAPASFPSIYIGANGFTNGGALATSATDSLPKRISEINRIPTKFRWSGSTDSFNATYDVWFAANDPAGQKYLDGLNGFLMIWLHDPGGNGSPPQPIGGQQGSVTLAGHSWNVWVGPRGAGDRSPDEDADLHPDPSAPVVSYTIAGNSIQELDFDLMDFINHAVTSGHLPGSLFLTDVFAGFEIWSGGAGNNLGVDEFTCVVE